jgi:hypothetical protein
LKKDHPSIPKRPQPLAQRRALHPLPREFHLQSQPRGKWIIKNQGATFVRIKAVIYRSMKVHILGIDLAKNVFQLHGVDRKGRPVLVRRVRREQLLKVLGELEPCLIGIEASTGAFYWQRQFEKLGHAVKIMAPQYVKPFVRAAFLTLLLEEKIGRTSDLYNV